MDEPRQVTTPSGHKRWVGADGRSYASRDEAAAAMPPETDFPSPQLEAPKKSKAAFLKEVIGLGAVVAFFGWLSIGGVYYLWSGQLHFESEWSWLILPVGWFFVAGLTVQSAASLYAVLSGRDDINTEAVWDWWVGKLGCGILWLIGGLIGLVLGWSVLSKMFEGVSKGTAIIAVLLFCILIALLQNNSNKR